jgi:DNA-binding response OmpR family regulator
MSDRPLILVVEDDPSVQGFLSVLLEGEGYDVVLAQDGLEGLVMVELRHPSLVILDVMMPNVSGERVLRELREDVRLNALPVLVVSGKHDVHEIFDPILGRENVFTKPFEPSVLVDRINEVLGT